MSVEGLPRSWSFKHQPSTPKSYTRPDLLDRETALSAVLSKALTHRRDNNYNDLLFNIWVWTGIYESQRRKLRWHPSPRSMYPKCIAHDIAVLMLARSRIRDAVCRYCFEEEWGKNGRFTEQKVLRLFEKYILTLFIEAWVFIDLVVERGTAGEKRGFWWKLFGMNDVEKLKRYRRLECGEIRMYPSEFVEKVARAEEHARVGGRGLKEGEREGWVARDFICCSEALRGFKEELKNLRRPVVEVEAIVC